MFNRKIVLTLCILFVLSLTALVYVVYTNDERENIYILTDQPEFAFYAELFNFTQDKYNAVVLYSDDVIEQLSQGKNQDLDIIVGAWLKNEKTRQSFMQVDYLFDEFKMRRSIFYPQLLELGNIHNRQYLLPVSFNLPTVIFDAEKSSQIQDAAMISLDEIKNIASLENKKNDNDTYSTMGYAPSWNEDFLYVVSKLMDVNYHETKDVFAWDEKSLSNAIEYLKNWTKEVNTSFEHEEEFEFKHLYNPPYNNVLTGHCFFNYMKTESLLNIPPENLEKIDFRWIQYNNNIQVNDKIINMGIFKETNNKKGAQDFLLWFFREETQREIIEWVLSMNLASDRFGIAGGFSSLKSVNERVLPSFYPFLFGRFPSPENLRVPNILPANWENIKERVIIPYFVKSIKMDEQNDVKPSLEKLLAQWARENN